MRAGEFLQAAADSGTITFTRSDSLTLSGTLNAQFTYFQYDTGPPPPFHLTGDFAFQNVGSSPMPPP